MHTAAVPSSTQNLQALQAAVSQGSSGTTSAAIDPSTVALANTLVAQAGGSDHISDAAQQLYTQSVAANNGLPSASDHADALAPASQTTHETNSTESSAISTVTSLIHTRTKTQIQVALQLQANLAFNAVLGIFPK